MNTNTPLESPIDPFEEPLAAEQNEKKGIDFEQTQHQLRMAIDYVHDSRSDFELNGKKQEWIDDVLHTLEKTLQEVRDLEIDHIDELVEWKDESGLPRQILVRAQDEKSFDTVMHAYTEAEKLFGEYMRKHFEAVQQQVHKQ